MTNDQSTSDETGTPDEAGTMAGRMPSRPSLSLAEFTDTPSGAEIDIVVEFQELRPGGAHAELAEPNPASSFTVFSRTGAHVDLSWGEETKVVMGERTDLKDSALVWVHGVLNDDGNVDATLLALMNEVGSIS